MTSLEHQLTFVLCLSQPVGQQEVEDPCASDGDSDYADSEGTIG